MHLFNNYKSINVPIGGRKYILYIANDNEKRRKGLSGIPFINKNEGMIFIYDESVYHSYTMADMKFPLHIIFFDENFQPIDSFNTKAHQKEEVRPRSDFKYVIEILRK
jgi:uncharacterized membrane protein (UPF0127 family)